LKEVKGRGRDEKVVFKRGQQDENTDNYVECANLADQILVAIDEFCPCVSRFSTGQFLFQPKLFIIYVAHNFTPISKINQDVPKIHVPFH
jgi:hypothetical protein